MKPLVAQFILPSARVSPPSLFFIPRQSSQTGWPSWISPVPTPAQHWQCFLALSRPWGPSRYLNKPQEGLPSRFQPRPVWLFSGSRQSWWREHTLGAILPPPAPPLPMLSHAQFFPQSHQEEIQCKTAYCSAPSSGHTTPQSPNSDGSPVPPRTKPNLLVTLEALHELSSADAPASPLITAPQLLTSGHTHLPAVPEGTVARCPLTPDLCAH